MRSITSWGLAFFLVLIFSNPKQIKAQEIEGKTYKVVKGHDNENLNKYKEAFEKADWNCYRTKSEDRTIEFDNGIVFELFSATKTISNGVVVSTNCLTDPAEIVDKSVFSLAQNGTILEGIPTYSSSKEVKALKQSKNEKNSITK